MMFTPSGRDKRVVENGNEVTNVPYFSVVNQRGFFNGSSPASLESSPSSSFSNGFSSPESDFRCLFPSYEDSKGVLMSGSHLFNASCFDPNAQNVSQCFNSVDELGLSRSFSRMNVREVQNDGRSRMKGFDLEKSDVFGFHGGNGNGGFGDSVQYNVKKYGVYDDFSHGCYDVRGFRSSSMSSDSEVKCTLNGLGRDVCDLNGCNQSNDLYSMSSWYHKRKNWLLEQRKEQVNLMSDRGSKFLNPSMTRSNLDDSFGCFQEHMMETSGGTDMLGSSLFPQSKLDLHWQKMLYDNFMSSARTTIPANNDIPQSLMPVKGAAAEMEAFNCEDGYILQGNGLNLVTNTRPGSLRSQRRKNSKGVSAENMQEKSTHVLLEPSCENHEMLGGYSLLPVVPTVKSLCEVKGYLIAVAQDQNGCRFLQRIFDEGTSDDVQTIFNEIIHDIVELMLKPFGNYVIQKFLDVCSEEQRLQIVQMVTKKPGQLVDICLNTYGTRVIQKLIETLKTRQQISSVIMALKPGFLDLVKDQNGNHVIQRFLQCLRDEDNQFIFDAAAKSCVEIATHRHGCCVMQRCIAHSMGKYREKLIVEVSKNGLLLAQDPFGNYVVQYVIELKNSLASAYMLTKFKGHYVQLAVQKFSSHVVEKCLKHFEESRSQIIREILSVSHFEQLMQDPYANYVIQSALAVTKGPLHSALVQAVQPHLILRTSPYCKRIFSRNLLKK